MNKIIKYLFFPVFLVSAIFIQLYFWILRLVVSTWAYYNIGLDLIRQKNEKYKNEISDPSEERTDNGSKEV